MADFRQTASLRARLGAAAVIAAAAWSAACGRGPDHAAPRFDGLTLAEALSPGTAHLTWSAARDASAPITYLVFVGDGPGTEDFAAAPIATTDATEITIAGLAPAARPTYFVVRARDAHGNTDDNTVEKSVTFSADRLTLEGSYGEPDFETSDIAVSMTANVVAMGGFVSSPQVRAYLFDVTTASTPVLIDALLGPGRSTDVEIRGHWLYVSTEDDSSVPPSGVYIYDLTDPYNVSQTPSASIHGPGLGQCHTIWLDGNWLYCASTDDGYIHILDVSDPLAPVAHGKVGIPGGQIHDMYVNGDFAVGCFLAKGWAFVDVSDKDAPVLLQRVQYDGAFTHNAWPTPDLHYLYTTDELPNGHLRIWDIHDHDAVTQVGEVYADPGASPHAIVHNVQIVGGYAWVSWYEAGAQVFDVSDPVHPWLVGSEDTFPDPTTGNFAGAWGVAPKPPYLYVSDLSTGLYVMRLGTAQ